MFFQFRADIVPINNEEFASAGENELTATFRLLPSTQWLAAELADVYDAGTNPNGLTTQFSYTFDNPYVPSIEWVSEEANGTAISNYALTYVDTDVFQISFNAIAPGGNLQSIQIIATAGSQQITVWNQSVAGAFWLGVATFSLPDSGTWTVVANILTLDGSLHVFALTQVGSATLFPLIIGLNPSTTVADPTYTIVTDPGHPNNWLITLSDITGGAAIYRTSVGATIAQPALPWAGGENIVSWIVSKRAFAQMFWMQARKAGLTSSNLIQVIIPASFF